MLNTVYEKPKMEFVNVQNENKIANTCWGHHNKGLHYTVIFLAKAGVHFKLHEGIAH